MTETSNSTHILLPVNLDALTPTELRHLHEAVLDRLSFKDLQLALELTKARYLSRHEEVRREFLRWAEEEARKVGLTLDMILGKPRTRRQRALPPPVS